MKAHCGKCGQFFVCKCPEAPPIIEFGPTPDDTLTFAEAMALDPDKEKLQVRWAKSPETGWHPFEPRSSYATNPDELWRSEFRRSRPRRSCVEEMAEDWRNNRRQEPVDGLLDRAIRAVCEWMRELQKREDADDELMPSDHAEAADQAERHFLEPR